ncbi:MAG: hypothetical protein HPKKFMNG_00244 [Planctomycetes bacterium]|mgnify:CR=1 FL=1|nr:hypothetical protein [Planctomycetota bacterium]
MSRSIENTLKKQAFVEEQHKENPKLTMNQIGKLVRQKFGTQLAFPKLKEVWERIGGKIENRGRRAQANAAQTPRKAGRRKSDKAAARVQRTLSGLPQHVVVVRGASGPETHEFTGRDQAVEFTRKQIEGGVPTSAIAYYQRQPMEVQIGI